jgi:AcrR family transcriptional regulator
MSTVTKDPLEESASRGRGRPRDEVCRGRILKAALLVFEELGFNNTTTDAIAERAGSGKTTIYRWWPNKAAVLVEALREAVAEELPFPDTGDLREDLRLQLRNFVKLITGPRGGAFKAFVAAAQSDPEVSEAFRSIWIRPRRGNAKARLERYRGSTFRADVDLDLVMDVIYGPLYYRLLIGRTEFPEDYTDRLTDLVLASILNA